MPSAGRNVFSSHVLCAALAAAVVLAGSYAANAQTLLVANKQEDTVSFVDLADGRECARVQTGPAPHEIAVSPDRQQAAVVAYGGSSIDLFDVQTMSLMRRIDLSPNLGPHGIAWIAPDRIVATFDRSNSVAILNPVTGDFASVATQQSSSHMLAVSPDFQTAYTANILSGTISVIDLGQGAKIGDIHVGGAPEAIAITPDGRQLWVGDDSGPVVRVVDISTQVVIATLASDPIAIRIAISADGRTAISSNFMSGTLTLFDTATLERRGTISLSGSAAAMQVTLAFAESGEQIFVAETGTDTVAEVDLISGTVLRRIAAGRGGDGLAIVPGNCRAQESDHAGE